MFGRIALYGALVMSSFALIVILVTHEYMRMFSAELPASVSLPQGMTTDVWGIFDPMSGEVIEGRNVESVRPIASITKLFTAYAVMESELKNEPFPITYADVNTEGRAGKLVAGERMTLYELLFPLLIESSNDAAAAIERRLGASFLSSVEELTVSLGLTRTTLTDASGLSAENASTVRELARFFAYLRRTHHHLLDITTLRMYIGERAGYINNDPVRSIAGFTGGKNGYTAEAGRTFVGTFTTGSSEVGIVLLGSTDVAADTERLLHFGDLLYYRE